MPYITVKLDSESDQVLRAAAKLQGRSKRAQLAYAAIAHARSILPDFKPTKQKGAK